MQTFLPRSRAQARSDVETESTLMEHLIELQLSQHMDVSAVLHKASEEKCTSIQLICTKKRWSLRRSCRSALSVACNARTTLKKNEKDGAARTRRKIFVDRESCDRQNTK
ncbi:hypothetical protein M758_2G051500 [Ceratodon purpureus]|nr:hypothetical protein M758_2G051500 [Ceratodon purpureus]